MGNRDKTREQLAHQLAEAQSHIQELRAENARLRDSERRARQAAETLRSASLAKGTFLANMGHKLRTPLNAILGFAQLMACDPALTAGQRESLEIIGQSGEHLLALINDFGVLYQPAGAASVQTAQPRPQEEPQPEQVSRDALTRGRCSPLPSALVTDLRQATIEGEFSEMLAIAERIREHDERLADALVDLINNFAYDQVLALVEQAGEPM